VRIFLILVLNIISIVAGCSTKSRIRMQIYVNHKIKNESMLSNISINIGLKKRNLIEILKEILIALKFQTNTIQRLM
jgi:hypothetical protein